MRRIAILTLFLAVLPTPAPAYELFAEVWITDVTASWSPNPLRPRLRANFPFFVGADEEAACEQEIRPNIEGYDAMCGGLANLARVQP